MKIHEIKYLLSKKGIRFSDIDKKFNLKVGSSRLAVSKSHKAGEEALSEVLGIPVQELFPERYDEIGNRLSPQPSENYRYKTIKEQVINNNA